MRIPSRICVFLLIAVIATSSQTSLSATPRSLPIQYLHNPIVYRPASTSTPGSPPFAPSDLWKAYDYLPLYARGYKGAGTRIAIIDAYGDPTISSDLSSFDSLTGLPSATLNFYYPDGVPRRGNSGWATETALDTEWAHAIAPEATIDLIIGLDNSLQNLDDAIAYVASNLPQETTLSMSWGDIEANYPTTGSFTINALHQQFTTITGHGTAIFASSGDSGSVGCCQVEYPASDPLIVGVGGTTLQLNSNASYVGETVWGGGGAGNSIVFAKPSWQKGDGDPLNRDSADVSYNADPNSGVLVVQNGVPLEVGGTSAGSPQWAGLIALASEANSQTYGAINARLYKLSSYHDVTSGFNGYFYAGAGWDYPTGLGTPDAYATIVGLSTPVPLAINNTQTFQGASLTTTASLTVSKFTGTLSGTTRAVARNSTTGVIMFNKTFTITNLQLQGSGTSFSGSFLISIPTNPYALSSNIQVSENSGNATGTVTVTRRIDVNGDGIVNILDLAAVASQFGLTANNAGFSPSADIDGDGAVDIVDLAHVAIFFQSTDYT